MPHYHVTNCPTTQAKPANPTRETEPGDLYRSISYRTRGEAERALSVWADSLRVNGFRVAGNVQEGYVGIGDTHSHAAQIEECEGVACSP